MWGLIINSSQEPHTFRPSIAPRRGNERWQLQFFSYLSPDQLPLGATRLFYGGHTPHSACKNRWCVQKIWYSNYYILLFSIIYKECIFIVKKSILISVNFLIHWSMLINNVCVLHQVYKIIHRRGCMWGSIIYREGEIKVIILIAATCAAYSWPPVEIHTARGCLYIMGIKLNWASIGKS